MNAENKMSAVERIKRLGENQTLLMAACVLVPMALVGVLYLAGVEGNYAFWAFLVACPLMHYAMMKGGKKCH